MTAEKKVFVAMLGITLAEGVPVLLAALPGSRLWWLQHPGVGTPLGWLAAAATAALFIAASLRSNALIRARFFDLNGLKLFAVLMALVSGLFEEAFVRRFAMEFLRHFRQGAVAQVAISAVVFGAVHGVWALGAGHPRAGMAAAIATTVLGALLGVVYLLSERSVLPCMVSHAVINLALEPWLLLSAFSGKWNPSTVATEATA